MNKINQITFIQFNLKFKDGGGGVDRRLPIVIDLKHFKQTSTMTELSQ